MPEGEATAHVESFASKQLDEGLASGVSHLLLTSHVTSVCCAQCPLFARKFGNTTVAAVRAATQNCSAPVTDIVTGCV